MNRRALLFGFLITAVCSALGETPPTWSFWISGGKQGTAPRLTTADDNLSSDFVRERAVDLTPGGRFTWLRPGLDVQEPQFVDPELEAVGQVARKNLTRAVYRDEGGPPKALLFLLETSDEQMRPFFFIVPDKGTKLSSKLDREGKGGARLVVVAERAGQASRRYEFSFAKSVPRLLSEERGALRRR